MISPSELRCVPAFSDLPEEQIVWFLSRAEEASPRAGDAFVRQGDPADWMIVFLEGSFQWRGEFGGDNVSLPAQAGEISGVFAFSRMTKFTVTGRALTDGRLLKFPAAILPELVHKMPKLTARLVAMMADRIREGTRIEQQRDRLISSGKLAAGLAHELNNPASAAQSASGGMRHALAKMRRLTRHCGGNRFMNPRSQTAQSLIRKAVTQVEMVSALLDASQLKPGSRFRHKLRSFDEREPNHIRCSTRDLR